MHDLEHTRLGRTMLDEYHHFIDTSAHTKPVAGAADQSIEWWQGAPRDYLLGEDLGPALQAMPRTLEIAARLLARSYPQVRMGGYRINGALPPDHVVAEGVFPLRPPRSTAEPLQSLVLRADAEMWDRRPWGAIRRLLTLQASTTVNLRLTHPQLPDVHYTALVVGMRHNRAHDGFYNSAVPSWRAQGIPFRERATLATYMIEEAMTEIMLKDFPPDPSGAWN
jgi:hypothetical protein